MIGVTLNFIVKGRYLVRIALHVITVFFIATLCEQVNAKDVIAVEYPPFTTGQEDEGGLAFSILLQAFPNAGFVPVILPPKRALVQLSNGQWCYSFYPPPKGVSTNKITLTKNEVVIGLVRLKQEVAFKWSSLSSFNGLTVAILRSDENSEFSRQFTEAGLNVVYVETVSQGLSLVSLKRADFSLYDNYNYGLLSDTIKSSLQFSEVALLTTPITLFVNPECDPNLIALQEPLIY
jgi:polar amino acid transport system substrate-binding protein